ncbi:MAG: PEP-CTERM sorting domain-containing protein [Pirellulaceae bacterium]|nr:PEP-CTERM sorting domain-containing protein [Pirellulaceae bacterium]
MKTQILSCAFAIAGLLLSAGFARAETLYSNDFETPTYATGGIFNQDGWEVTGLTPSNWVEPYVGNGANGNTSQVFLGNPAGTTSTAKSSGAKRYYSTPLMFDAGVGGDDAIELNFSGYVEFGDKESKEYGDLTIGMMWEGVPEHYGLGIYTLDASGSPLQLNTLFRDGKSNIVRGDELVPGHWYDVKAVMDFTQLCSDGETYGKLTYKYLDVTAGDTEYTIDGTFNNVDMFVPLNGSGKVQSNGIFAYTKAYDDNYQQTQYIDNISVVRSEQIPEPGTLALLAAGMIGLLAYAWKRRR